MIVYTFTILYKLHYLVDFCTLLEGSGPYNFKHELSNKKQIYELFNFILIKTIYIHS